MQQAFHKHMYKWVWVTPLVDFGTNKVNVDSEIMYVLSNVGKQCKHQINFKERWLPLTHKYTLVHNKFGKESLNAYIWTIE